MKNQGSLKITRAVVGVSVGRSSTASSEVLPLRHGWLLRYRDYQTFSWPWVGHRSAGLGAGGLALAALISIGLAFKPGEGHISAIEFALGTVSWLLCVGLGPVLAALVLGRQWPHPRENTAVMGAIVIGAAIAAGSIVIVEQPIEREIFAPGELAEETLLPEEDAGRDIGSEMPGSTDVTDIAAGLPGQFHVVRPLADFLPAFALSLLFSGSLALPAFFREKRHFEEEMQEHRIDKLRLQKKEADLRLLVLQAQIEPHFLFNTLASLRSILESDADRAIAMIDALVEHLRATLPSRRDSDDTSTLSQQVAICQSYLEVMKLRTADRLNYRIDVPAICGDMSFPPLMLLTLVENAVKHGIEPKPGPGMIRIEAERRLASDGARTVVRVIDDGAGLKADRAHGVGLTYIREQLALRYRAGAALSLCARPEGGAEATLEIPEGAGWIDESNHADSRGRGATAQGIAQPAVDAVAGTRSRCRMRRRPVGT